MSSRQLFIISAPSGAGKTSLIKSLIMQDSQLCLSVSYTTRKPRVGERNGVNYHFVDDKQFKEMLTNGDFIEHAQVFDHYYGTALIAMEEKFAANLDVILEIDWQGARQVRSHYPQCIGIFILPPSRTALQQRLKGRNQDSTQIIDRRMADSISEISHYSEFNYVVINDDFDQCLSEIQSIVRAQRLKQAFQAERHQQLIKKLLAS